MKSTLLCALALRDDEGWVQGGVASAEVVKFTAAQRLRLRGRRRRECQPLMMQARSTSAAVTLKIRCS